MVRQTASDRRRVCGGDGIVAKSKPSCAADRSARRRVARSVGRGGRSDLRSSGRYSGRVASDFVSSLVTVDFALPNRNDSLPNKEPNPMTRSYINTTRMDELSANLSPKEIAVLVTLREVRLATASQLQRLHFADDSPRNRARVLQAMNERGLITRLDRVVGGRRAGSSGFLYSLGVAGLRLLLVGQDGPVRRPSTPGAPFVAHALAVTELAVRLREAERRGDFQILDFQAEPQCWRRHPGPGGGTETCKPDAYVRLAIGAFDDSWFVEVDRSTESATTLDRKLGAYRRYWSSGIEQAKVGIFPRVLWLVPDERRHQVVSDACNRQPAEAWQLHQVTIYDDAVNLMIGGAS
jgi:hypothetical protein